jgi:NAD(P)H-dependent FMN reductase
VPPANSKALPGLVGSKNVTVLELTDSYHVATLDHDLPLLDEPVPPSMGQYSKDHTKRWAAKIASFDAFVFVVPEYNHGISGALKNAIDFLFAEWNNKAAGFVSYGSAYGVRAVEHLRGVCGEIKIADVRAHVMLSLFTDFGTMGRLDNLSGFRQCTGRQYSGAGTCVKDNLAFRGSAGVSVTWKSPFGPVQIDLGLPYAKTAYDRPQIIHFSTATGY